MFCNQVAKLSFLETSDNKKEIDYLFFVNLSLFHKKHYIATASRLCFLVLIIVNCPQKYDDASIKY